MYTQTSTNSEQMPLPELQLPEELPNFRTWILEMTGNYLRGSVLEIGSGHGNMSSLLLERGLTLHLTDTHKECREILRVKFSGSPNVRSIRNIDFQDPSFDKKYDRYFDLFSTVVAVNIFEHGHYDGIIIENAKRLIRNEGYLIAVLPVYTSVFNEIEQNKDILNKYNRKHLKQLVGEKFEIRKAEYINLKEKPVDFHRQKIGLSVLLAAKKSTQK